MRAVNRKEGCPQMRVVPMAGLEPARIAPADFKSAVSAYSTTSANIRASITGGSYCFIQCYCFPRR